MGGGRRPLCHSNTTSTHFPGGWSTFPSAVTARVVSRVPPEPRGGGGVTRTASLAPLYSEDRSPPPGPASPTAQPGYPPAGVSSSEGKKEEKCCRNFGDCVFSLPAVRRGRLTAARAGPKPSASKPALRELARRGRRPGPGAGGRAAQAHPARGGGGGPRDKAAAQARRAHGGGGGGEPRAPLTCRARRSRASAAGPRPARAAAPRAAAGPAAAQWRWRQRRRRGAPAVPGPRRGARRPGATPFSPPRLRGQRTRGPRGEERLSHPGPRPPRRGRPAPPRARPAPARPFARPAWEPRRRAARARPAWGSRTKSTAHASGGPIRRRHRPSVRELTDSRVRGRAEQRRGRIPGYKGGGNRRRVKRWVLQPDRR